MINRLIFRFFILSLTKLDLGLLCTLQSTQPKTIVLKIDLA
jgi:hypothetical protein